LESRCTPASFSILDSFAGAVNVADGGTAPAPGTGSALIVNSASQVAMGTDTTLRTGSATGFIGSANPNQVADSRALTLAWQGPGLNSNSAQVSGGLGWTGSPSNAASLTVDYENLSANGPEMLVNKTIAVHGTALDGFPNLDLNINGTLVATSALAFALNAEADFDASAFVGQQINSIKFVVRMPFDGTGTLNPSGSISEIDAAFASPAASHPPGFWMSHPLLWPLSRLAIGGFTYNQTQLIAVLSTPTGGDAVLILADQLIAAELSILNGSAHSSTTDAKIGDANALLEGINLLSHARVNPNTLLGSEMIADASYLDRYDNGLTV
jgi:hypothetical protein